MRRLWIVAALLLGIVAPQETLMADTNWLHETFEAGTITYGTKPAQWTYSGTSLASYPLIYEIGYLDAYAGVGAGGGYGLRVIPELLDPDYNFYSGYLSMYPQAQGTMSPNAAQGFAQIDLEFDSNLTDLEEWSGDSPGFHLFGLAKSGIDVKLVPDGANWKYQVKWKKYTHYESVSNGSALSAAFTTAEVATGAFRTIRLEWQQSTLTNVVPSGNNWYTVASDGWMKLLVDGVAVIDLSGIQLMINAYGYDDSFDGYHTEYVGTYGVWYTYSVPGTLDNITLGTWAGATWVDVPNFKREWIDASRYPGGVARCLCMLWATAAGVNVQARLVSLLADGEAVDAVVGTSADVTAVVPMDATFAVTLVGNKRHKLQLTSSTPLTDLWCAPGAKVTA